MPAENQPEAYPEHTYIHTLVSRASHTILIYKTVPYTFNIGYRALTSQLQQTGVTELGNRLQRYYYGYTEARKNLPKKNPFGEKIRQEIGVGTKAQNSKQLAAHPTRLYNSNTINFKLKRNLASAKG